MAYCPRCSLVNALDNKYCSRCSYPLVASAFDEIKVAEDMKLQALKEEHEKDMVTMREEMESKFQQILAKIANTAKLGEITKRHEFDTMNEVIKKEIPAGKHPASLAATVLYLACKKSGERISHDNLAHAAGITGVTIRARLKELTRALN